jgi:glutamate carboxypeptidase
MEGDCMQGNVFLEHALRVVPALMEDLERIVNIDSGTYTKGGIDKVNAYVQRRFQEFGFDTWVDQQEVYGNNLVATGKGDDVKGAHIVLIGHMDTVFPEGEVGRRPFSRQQADGVEIAKGPGVLDMKSGLLVGLYALRVLKEMGKDYYKQVTFICNSDEEIGSPGSKKLITSLAREADAALVLEPGRKLHTIVSSRKGIGVYRIEVRGRAAHAGVEPDKGRSAILELSHKVIALQAINGTIPGVTVNVGTIHGGERTNIVPDFAFCEIDVRVTDQAGLAAVEAAIDEVVKRQFVEGTTTELSGGIKSMPFEKSKRSAQLVQLVKEAGVPLGLQIEDIFTGGASDANNTAELGIATADGFGPAGGLAHNPDEYIEVDSIAVRIALLCEVVLRIHEFYQQGNRL